MYIEVEGQFVDLGQKGHLFSDASGVDMAVLVIFWVLPQGVE
jgi:hypothetical protein